MKVKKFNKKILQMCEIIKKEEELILSKNKQLNEFLQGLKALVKKEGCYIDVYVYGERIDQFTPDNGVTDLVRDRAETLDLIKTRIKAGRVKITNDRGFIKVLF